MATEKPRRPFPWRCPKCRQREVRPATVSHTSRIKHEGRLHEVNVGELRVPKCGACREIVFDNLADEQIAKALRAHLGLLQSEHIRKQREALGLTQADIAGQLGVAKETVSRWETGALTQSRAMDRYLRVYFEFRNVQAALAAAGGRPEFGVGEQPAPVAGEGGKDVSRDILRLWVSAGRAALRQANIPSGGWQIVSHDFTSAQRFLRSAFIWSLEEDAEKLEDAAHFLTFLHRLEPAGPRQAALFNEREPKRPSLTRRMGELAHDLAEVPREDRDSLLENMQGIVGTARRLSTGKSAEYSEVSVSPPNSAPEM